MTYNLQRYPIVLFLFLAILSMDLQGQTLAFPGAEGYGRYVTGGRGGEVIAVTNLGDSGPGSFRDAVSQSGPRTIVFQVSGRIELTSSLSISNGNLTIAGQTAPGGGILISGRGVTLDASNVIIRFVRFRLGDQNEQEADALSSRFGENIIIDHCTFSWGVDEVMSMYRNTNTTFQWNIVSESLNSSVHHKGDHGYGGIWGGTNASFHHNIIAHNNSRNPRMNGSRYAPGNERVDFRNNVIYNWGGNNLYGAEPENEVAEYNLVNNYYKAGPASSNRSRIISPDDHEGAYSLFYVDGNYVDGYPDITADNWDGGVQGVNSDMLPTLRVDEPFDYDMDATHTAKEAMELVLRNAGVVFPYRDEVDERIAMEVATGTAVGNGIIDSQEDIGGYPELPEGTAPGDADNDGMPDIWEVENGLNPNSADNNEDPDGDGYTNLEDYLNRLVEETLAENIEYLPQPTGLSLMVDQVSRNSTTISWDPIPGDGVEVVVERALNDENGDQEPFEEVSTISGDTTFSEVLPLDDDNRVYYRIKAVSGETESFYSSEVTSFVTKGEVLTLADELKFTVYPNPVVNNQLTINSKDGIRSVLISDLSGRTIFRAEDLKQNSINIMTNTWKSGYYLVKITNSSGEIKSNKVIKR